MKRFIFQCALLFGPACFPAYADYSGIEEQRKLLCQYLPDGQRCEETKNVFGNPPVGSIIEDIKYELCTREKCTPTKTIIPMSELPKGSSFRIHQTLTVISKNGTKKTWYGEDEYAFEGEGKGSSYVISFEKKHQYFWVQGLFYEGGSDEWVSYRTGKAYGFSDQPHISPDGNHIFEYSRAMDDPEQPIISITIYSINESDLTKETQFRIDNKFRKKLGWQSLVDMRPLWVSSTEIAMISHTVIDRRTVKGVVARIVYKDNKWSFIIENANPA